MAGNEVKVLWLTRHKPQEEQLRALQERFGSVIIIHKEATLDNDPAKGAQQLLDMMREVDADEVVCVLPVPHLAELTKRGLRPIRAVMQRVPTGRVMENGEPEYVFRFEKFERVLRVEVVTEPL